MENINLFEMATRMKMRFPYKGLIGVEELWDLGVKQLDTVFKQLNSARKVVQEESLLDTKSDADEAMDMQINIIKYIVSVKQAEASAAAKARENKEEKQKIMSILSAKKDAVLEGKSVEELEAMLADIGK